MVDPLGHRSAWSYDALGRLVGATEPTGDETRYSFDEQGNRILQIDALSRKIRFEYDVMGRLTKRTLDDGSSEGYEYDAVGNQIRKIDFLGRETVYLYDVNDRLVERSYSDGRVVKFTYTPEGRRLTVEDDRGITRYTYDPLDRFERLTYPDGRELRYAYDANGNLASLVADLQDAVLLETRYSYDAMNRLTSLTDSSGEVYSYTYDAAGHRVQQSYPNGLQTHYTYDTLNRLVSVATQGAGGVPLQRLDYVLDESGRRVAIDEPGGRRSFGYDEASRLTSERLDDGSGTVSETVFSYDPTGNRTRRSLFESGVEIDNVNFTYDGRDRLLSAGAATFTWDATGNLVASDGTSLEWDSDNRLRKVTLDSGWVVEHRYDADGVRVETVATAPDGTTKTKWYLGDASLPISQVIAETDASGALEVSYARGHD
ncbi:MAG: RHS repeat protein, partial [bacterium]|nr:RHS repeat protein [bacterium]